MGLKSRKAFGWSLSIGAVAALISVTFSLVLAELVLSYFLVASWPLRPVPPHSIQRHTTAEYSVDYAYNNVSFRGPDFVPGTYDLVLLGDSFLFGQGLPYQKTAAALFEKQRLKVLNLSEIATNPVEYYLRLKRGAAMGAAAKTLVAGLFVGNDFQGLRDIEDVSPLFRYEGDDLLKDSHFLSFIRLQRISFLIKKTRNHLIGRKYTVPAYSFRRKFNKDWIAWYCRGQEAAIQQMKNLRYKPVRNEQEYFELAELQEESIAKTVAVLKETAKLMPGAAKILVLIPDRHFAAGELGAEYLRRIESLKERLAPVYKVIDLHGIVTPGMFFKNDGHWNEIGHEAAARVIGEAL